MTDEKKLLDRLPSVQQLLETPAIADLVDKANHSVVADGVRDLLRGVSKKIKDKAVYANLPPIDQLAEKFERWTSGATVGGHVLFLNATGSLVSCSEQGGERFGWPLGQVGLEAIQLGRKGFSTISGKEPKGKGGDCSLKERQQREIEEKLARHVGVEDVLICHNPFGIIPILCEQSGGAVVRHSQYDNLVDWEELTDFLGVDGTPVAFLSPNQLLKKGSKDHTGSRQESLEGNKPEEDSTLPIVAYLEEATLLDLSDYGMPKV
ncbi:MAG: hypothetical protein MPJ24_11100, partial [Pirellulaceae bacterium]|nr:hypothetical protein [Pirellulaceae bacterium]